MARRPQLPWPHALVSCAASIVFACSTLPVSAADHFLTIGGGNSANNNQVSLEKNVLYLQRFLADRGFGDVPHEILFSDGNAGARDLQFIDPKATPPRVNQLLAEVFHQERGFDLQYRAHSIPHLWGPSGRQGINHWFETVAPTLKENDRLFIYYTGHGGRGTPPQNTTLAMWNEPDMPVKEFVKLLDRLPPGVSTVLVMVQCFSGGFADVIFKDAEPGQGLSPRNRCGFFATVPDRPAAGCTADADEENYHEYSTYFWAALYGRTRTGEAAPSADYDNDGQNSLAEAHAYALIASDTIDISVKTSDAFLRHFSKMGTSGGTDGLLSPDVSFEMLLKLAQPAERAVLMGLSDQLQLEGSDHTKAARTLGQVLGQRRKGIEEKQQKLRSAHDQACGALQAQLRARWPELSNFLHPRMAALLGQEADSIVKAIESSPQFSEMQKQDAQYEQLDRESTELERKWVKCQRFVRVAESVALAANLWSVAPPDVQRRYELLLAAENGVLKKPSL